MRHRALLMTAAILMLTGCGGNSGAQTTPTPVPQVNQTATAEATEGAASEASTSSSSGAAGSETEAAKSYFTALVSNDPDMMSDALKYAASGSLAEAYAKHLSYAEQARLDGGSSEDPDTLDCDGSDGTYGSYDDDQNCSVWQNVRFSGGKVADFTVKSVDISKRITLGDGGVLNAGKLAEVTFLSAYQSVQSKSLFVVVKVKSGSKKIETSGAYSAKYRDPSGRQGQATDADGPGELDKNSIGYVSMIFKNAKPGGVVTLDMSDSNFDSTVSVRIKTA